MMCVKFVGNTGISVRWFKKGYWLILPTIGIWKEGVVFAWIKLVLKIFRFKLVELKKGGEV